MLPPMQFALMDLVGPVLVILIIAGIEGAQSFETAKIKVTTTGWYLRMVVVLAATMMPLMIIPSAISRADVGNQVAIWTKVGWGIAAAIVIWAIIGAMPPVRRWLSSPSRKARELEGKSVV